jgi:two-component sensor histidine kinase
MPYITYFPAILFASFFGGFWAGWSALVGTIVLTWGAFLPPFYSFEMPSYPEIATLAMFTLTASIVVAGAEHYRRMLERLREEEHHRELLVGELEHRMKNKVATVYAIVGHELRGNPQIWEKIGGRLAALAAADDFIARSDGQGTYLRNLLAMEFAPYDPSRIRMHCEDVFIPAKAATILALMFHELATNAMKYGALSAADGRVTVDWKKSGDELTLHWTERGGPTISAPTARGFGTTLLERGLEAYRGRIAMWFEPAGFACRMSFVLPDQNAPVSHQAYTFLRSRASTNSLHA